MERGEPSWQTRSTVPTSMPSSSDAVATTTAQLARLEPLLGLEAPRAARLPWCAATALLRPGARPGAAVTRSDQPPRVDEDQRGAVGAGQLGHAVVDLAPTARWCRPRPARRAAPRSPDPCRGAGRRRRSRAAAAPRRRGAAPPSRSASPSPRARCAGAARPPLASATRASSRSSESARCAPRLSPATAWISSTMTVRDVREPAPARFRGEQDVERLGRGDQDVRRARRPAWRRSRAGVSPVRTRGADLRRGQPRRGGGRGQLAQRLVAGCAGCRWTAP